MGYVEHHIIEKAFFTSAPAPGSTGSDWPKKWRCAAPS